MKHEGSTRKWHDTDKRIDIVQVACSCGWTSKTLCLDGITSQEKISKWLLDDFERHVARDTDDPEILPVHLL